MDRLLQWVWERCGARYSWVIWVITYLIGLPVWLVWSLAVVAVEGSGHYMEAALVTVVLLVVFSYTLVLPGLASIHRSTLVGGVGFR
jgi:adenylate cyclase